MSEQSLSRRRFIVAGAAAAAGSVARATEPAISREGGRERSRVVLIRDRDAVREDGSVNDSVVPGMLDRAVTALFEADDAAAAWREITGPSDVVGIKSNVWSHLPTPHSLEERIRARLVEIGVAASDIAVDDRGVRANPVFRRATALINIRPMRTHHWSGLGTVLKNPIMFVPRPADYHADACASLGALWHLPEIKGKVRLNVLVMLTPQFHGVGPHSFSPRFVWPYKGLIVGVDPVAVDATGARVIQAKRNLFFNGNRPITPSPHHITIADERYHLGVSDPSLIDIVRIGPMDEALV